MSYNKDFQNGPRDFANLHTLYPFADPVVNLAHMATKALSDGSTFQQVQGDNKVAWCNIKQVGDFPNVPGDLGGNYNNDTNLLVMRITYQKSGSAFPVYFLPWQKNSMIRIKLKPSPNYPTQTGIIKKDTVEPEVFVTAALQGCTVIVSGDPDEPVVYHLNAAGTKGPHGESLATNDDADFGAAVGAKIQKMQTMYQLARTEHTKEGQKTVGVRPAQTFLSKSATMDQYAPGNLPTNVGRLKDQNAVPTTKSVYQCGTIFGIRDANGWKFYRQTRTRIFNINSGNWVNPVCVRFWPA